MEINEQFFMEYSILDNYFPSTSTSDESSITLHDTPDINIVSNNVRKNESKRKKKVMSRVNVEEKENRGQKKLKKSQAQPEELNEQQELATKSMMEAFKKLKSLILPCTTLDVDKTDIQLYILRMSISAVQEMRRELQNMNGTAQKTDVQKPKLLDNNEFNNVQYPAKLISNQSKKQNKAHSSKMVKETCLKSSSNKKNKVKSPELASIRQYRAIRPKGINNEHNKVQSPQMISTGHFKATCPKSSSNEENKVQSPEMDSTWRIRAILAIINEQNNEYSNVQYPTKLSSNQSIGQNTEHSSKMVQSPEIVSTRQFRAMYPMAIINEQNSAQHPAMDSTGQFRALYPMAIINEQNSAQHPAMDITGQFRAMYPMDIINEQNKEQFPEMVSTEQFMAIYPKAIGNVHNKEISAEQFNTRHIKAISSTEFSNGKSTLQSNLALQQSQVPKRPFHNQYTVRSSNVLTADQYQFENPHVLGQQSSNVLSTHQYNLQRILTEHHALKAPYVLTSQSPYDLSTDQNLLLKDTLFYKQSNNTALNSLQGYSYSNMGVPPMSQGMSVYQKDVYGMSANSKVCDNIQPDQLSQESYPSGLQTLWSFPSTLSHNINNKYCYNTESYDTENKQFPKHFGTKNTIQKSTELQLQGSTSAVSTRKYVNITQCRQSVDNERSLQSDLHMYSHPNIYDSNDLTSPQMNQDSSTPSSDTSIATSSATSSDTSIATSSATSSDTSIATSSATSSDTSVATSPATSSDTSIATSSDTNTTRDSVSPSDHSPISLQMSQSLFDKDKTLAESSTFTHTDECFPDTGYSFTELMNIPAAKFCQLFSMEQDNYQSHDITCHGYSDYDQDCPDFLLSSTK